MTLKPAVVRRPEANAAALAGGYIYIFQGLIEKAESVDEVAGVIAHELGHVAHRDGTKALIQAGGLSFLFGMLLGDFVGGGAVVMAATSLLQSAYSREAESCRRRIRRAGHAEAGGGCPRPWSLPRSCRRRQGARFLDFSRSPRHPRTAGGHQCLGAAAKWWRKAPGKR